MGGKNSKSEFKAELIDLSSNKLNDRIIEEIMMLTFCIFYQF